MNEFDDEDDYEDEEAAEVTIEPYTNKATAAQNRRALASFDHAWTMAMQACELEKQDDDDEDIAEIAAAYKYLKATLKT